MVSQRSRQITHFYKVNHAPLCHFAIKQHSLEVQLKPSRGLGREGEIAVFLSLDGQVLMKASFTVLSLDLIGLPGKGYAMYVGAFQAEKDKQSGHWVLPRNWVPRSLEEIESKKRAAYRRRSAIRQLFIDACLGGGPALMADSDTH
jgi:uncharacterized protein VirK/YbjX